MLVISPEGLYCPAGNFYIDPQKGVEHAVITHAHSDHARRGSVNYYCVRSGVDLLKTRLGQNINVYSFPYHEKFYFGDVGISFHPAGHILGSSQIRVEFNGEIWVVSGDYKREMDTTCESFENVKCDVFITEATFGTPAFKWDKTIDYGEAIYQWWLKNSKQGINSVLFAYTLGKTQRILGSLFKKMEKKIICHPAGEELNQCYRNQNIKLADTIAVNNMKYKDINGDLFLVPHSFLQSPDQPLLGRKYQTAFASGWTRKGFDQYDTTFTMSDHADWDDLIRTIVESNASRVYVQHRGNGALVKQLRSLGIEAYPDSALIPKNPKQLAFI